MDDLISRSALINRFKQLQGSDTLANMFVSDVIKEVKNQPTVYNVDKVVEQIKTHNYSDGIGWLALTEVTTMVKAGGVNG